jgi:hypothetical protein
MSTIEQQECKSLPSVVIYLNGQSAKAEPEVAKVAFDERI